MLLAEPVRPHAIPLGTFWQLANFEPPEMLTPLHCHPLQLPEPQTISMRFALLATVPRTFCTVRPVIGTPVDGVPVLPPFKLERRMYTRSAIEVRFNLVKTH